MLRHGGTAVVFAVAACAPVVAAPAAGADSKAPGDAAIRQEAAAMQADLAAMIAARDRLLDDLEKRWRAAHAVEPARSLAFTLQGAILGGPLVVELRRFGGRWTGCVACCPGRHKSRNRVDAAGLKLAGGRLKGRMKVTIVSDGWWPAWGVSHELTFDIDATVRDGKMEGSYHAPACPGLQTEVTVKDEAEKAGRGPVRIRTVRQVECRGKLAGESADLPPDLKRPSATAPAKLEGDDAAGLYAAATAIEQQADEVYRQALAADLAATSGISWAEAMPLAPVHRLLRPKFDAAGAGGVPAAMRRRLARMGSLLQAGADRKPGPVEVLVGPMSTSDPDFRGYFGQEALARSDDGANLLGRAAADGPQLWRYVLSWQVAGPFPPDERRDLFAANLPEIVEAPAARYAIEEDLKASVILDAEAGEGGFATWRPAQSRAGMIQSPWKAPKKQAGPKGGIFYAAAELRSAVEQDVWLALGVDDYGKCWVNDRLVWVGGIAFLPGDRGTAVFRVHLNRGANRLLFRYQNDWGGQWFWLKVCVRGRPRTAEEIAADDRRIAAARKRIGPGKVRGWRGDWTGRYPDANCVTAWDIERGINVLWRVRLKEFSNATPVIVGNRLLTNSEPRTLICLDKMTGEILWVQDGGSAGPVIGDEARGRVVEGRSLGTRPSTGPVPWSLRGMSYGNWMGNSMPTPVTDGQHIWVKNGGSAVCYDLAGRLKWVAQTHLAATDHPMNVPSPVLAGRVLVVEGGVTPYWQANSRNLIPPERLPPMRNKYPHWLVGLDADTGKILWDAGPVNGGGYGGPCTPVPVTLTNGRDVMTVVVTGEGHVIRPDDGKILIPYAGTRCAASSPQLLGHCAIFSHYTVAAAELLMQSRDLVGARVKYVTYARPGFGGMVCHDGLLYGMSGGKQPTVIVIDAATGRKVYTAPAPMDLPRGSTDYPHPAATAKHVFLFASHRVAVVEPGPRPRLVAVNDTERMFSGPVFDGDRMYLRTYDAITCIARKGEDGARYERQVQARMLLADVEADLQRRADKAVPDADDAAVLRRVMKLAPGSEEAGRAAALLKPASRP